MKYRNCLLYTSGTGRYEITDEMRAKLQDFAGGYATEAETAEEIRTLYEKTGYVLDTHTAVASYVYRKWKEQNHPTAPVVIASTASPFKFARSVMSAIDAKYAGMEDFALIDELSRIANVPVPKAVEAVSYTHLRQINGLITVEKNRMWSVSPIQMQL